MRVLFQGDSVTDCGRDRTAFHDLGKGYVLYTAEALRAEFPGLELLNRGISGNRSKDLLARAEEDIVALDPDIITILIGVNDVWRRYDRGDPTSAEQFRANYEAILTCVKERTRAKIVMIEPFLIYGMGRDNYREDLNPKLDVVRELAFQYADAFLPLDGILAAETLHRDPAVLSADGVHPAEEGRKVIAQYLAPVIAKLL